MGNTSDSVFTKTKNLTLAEFNKNTLRKMSLHILSPETNSIEKCTELINHFTKCSPRNGKDLMEEDIKDKVNLFSYMNYHSYRNPISLMDSLSTKIELCIEKLGIGTAFFSEVILVICNKEQEKRKKQIDSLKNEINNNENIKDNLCYYPFIIFLCKEDLYLSDF